MFIYKIRSSTDKQTIYVNRKTAREATKKLTDWPQVSIVVDVWCRKLMSMEIIAGCTIDTCSYLDSVLDDERMWRVISVMMIDVVMVMLMLMLQLTGHRCRSCPVHHQSTQRSVLIIHHCLSITVSISLWHDLSLFLSPSSAGEM